MDTKLKDESTPKVQEFQFRDTPKTTKWEDFQKFVYDPSKKEFFGRTKTGWYQLGLFYCIFYACLVAFFSICMSGMLSTLSDTEPKWKLSESLIGTNPGLGFRPISKDLGEGSLIRYNLKDSNSIQKWVDLVDEFLLPYSVEQVGKNYKDCSFDVDVCSHHVCSVKLDQFGPCQSSNGYGYNSTSPCVFLKLNRIFGWMPDYYTEGQQDMPSDLAELVNNATTQNKTEVWISCQGEQPGDKEKIGGFRYYPQQGIPSYYFPYINNENYLSPLIAVQISISEPNTVVNIECRAWAKNINYHGGNRDRQGSVHFEILVDL